MSDILLPILSLLPFIDRNFDEKFAVLKAGPHYGKGPSRGYKYVFLGLNPSLETYLGESHQAGDTDSEVMK